ncbi:palmitoyltransferase ZDHHC6-like [Orbicella faveolata]|uniref:palmitoyltransferase ZDHHC6-like n=1 Tax=Orbicella faveolata TaxID=48498 RepID=UPI0009E29BC6|nr:palmitoyltransferase ZDHHC6-like [Orbicella faveolata]
MMSGGICHWGPLVALSIIITLFLCGLYCTLLWFPPWTSIASVIHLAFFLTWMFLIMNYFLKSIYLGPGHLPLGWRADDKEVQDVLQKCVVCNGYKAPRAHHCSKCKRCVMKMDHHCPWINNCVGHLNHRAFTLFLFFVPIGCTHTTVILISCFLQQFYLMSGSPYRRIVFQRNAVVSFTFYHVILVLFCIGLSLGVTIAVGILLYYQVQIDSGINYTFKILSCTQSFIVTCSQNVLVKNYNNLLATKYGGCSMNTNITYFKENILLVFLFSSSSSEKGKGANRPHPDGKTFTYPYDFGWKENFKQVITLRKDYVGDGITWPVIDGCDQYTLTREQLQQKKLKRERTICCSVIKFYNGSIIAWREGLRTCISTPWSEEPRMKLHLGEIVLVTRWRARWLYGEKLRSNSPSAENTDEVVGKEKGWFPRHCVVRTAEEASSKKDD